MASVEGLALRLRQALQAEKDVSERRMFGGVCFMLRNHMLCGAGKSGFLFRVGKMREAEALRRPGATAMEFGGRRMGGFVWVDPARCDRRALKSWVALAEAYVATLPVKEPKKTRLGGRKRFDNGG